MSKATDEQSAEHPAPVAGKKTGRVVWVLGSLVVLGAVAAIGGYAWFNIYKPKIEFVKECQIFCEQSMSAQLAVGEPMAFEAYTEEQDGLNSVFRQAVSGPLGKGNLIVKASFDAGVGWKRDAILLETETEEIDLAADDFSNLEIIDGM